MLYYQIIIDYSNFVSGDKMEEFSNNGSSCGCGESPTGEGIGGTQSVVEIPRMPEVQHSR